MPAATHSSIESNNSNNDLWGTSQGGAKLEAPLRTEPHPPTTRSFALLRRFSHAGCLVPRRRWTLHADRSAISWLPGVSRL